jgi:hypothetical protein
LFTSSVTFEGDRTAFICMHFDKIAAMYNLIGEYESVRKASIFARYDERDDALIFDLVFQSARDAMAFSSVFPFTDISAYGNIYFIAAAHCGKIITVSISGRQTSL